MQVFAKCAHNFDPEADPLVAFPNEKDCRDFLSISQTGDRLVFVGAVDETVSPKHRGRLLGMGEFSRIPVRHPTGSSLPLVRAWAFEPKLKLIDTLNEQLTFGAVTSAIRLGESDAKIALSLPRKQVRVRSYSLTEDSLASEAPEPSEPTTGPLPTEWTGTVTRSAERDAYTYALRFGERDLWKVGHTQDLASRLSEINQHVPHEEIGERWAILLHMGWKSSVEAYQLEQQVLQRLERHRTHGERLRCSHEDLLTAWESCISMLADT